MGYFFSQLIECLIIGLVGCWLAGRIIGERGKAAIVAGAALGGMAPPSLPGSPIINIVGSAIVAIFFATLVHFLIRRAGQGGRAGEERQHGQQPI